MRHLGVLHAASMSVLDPRGKGQSPTPETLTPDSHKLQELSNTVRGCNGTVQLPPKQNLNLESCAQKGASGSWLSTRFLLQTVNIN